LRGIAKAAIPRNYFVLSKIKKINYATLPFCIISAGWDILGLDSFKEVIPMSNNNNNSYNNSKQNSQNNQSNSSSNQKSQSNSSNNNSNSNNSSNKSNKQGSC